jgi:multisubunit Na+/H+ antiporter MnhB subunit
MSSSQPEDADNTKREQRQRRMRRSRVAMAIITACLGLFAFSSVASKPRFETYHTLDVIRLMIAGAGFAVALVLLIQFFNFPGPRSETKKEKEQGTS